MKNQPLEEVPTLPAQEKGESLDCPPFGPISFSIQMINSGHSHVTFFSFPRNFQSEKDNFLTSIYP